MQADAESVRALNVRFYRALSAQNLLEMEAIWSHATHVRCVHPGASLLRGWDSIRDSWRDVFRGAICMTVEPEDEQVTVHGLMAIVTCNENITQFTLDGSSSVRALATNVYEKRQGRWQLIVHHASPLASRNGGAV